MVSCLAREDRQWIISIADHNEVVFCLGSIVYESGGSPPNEVEAAAIDNRIRESNVIWVRVLRDRKHGACKGDKNEGG